MKNLFLCLVLIFASFSSFSHQGGHHKKSDQVNEHVWMTPEGEIAAIGSFLAVKGQSILVESKEGITEVPIALLSKSDQQLAMAKIVETRLINRWEKKSLIPHDIPQIERSLIIGFAVICTVGLIILLIVAGGMYRSRVSVPVLMFLFISLSFLPAGCGSSNDKDPEPDDSETSFTNDPTYMQASFELYPESITGTSHDDTYFYVGTNSIPNHQMMVGITAWIGQVPVPHYYEGDEAWSIPLNPTFSDETITIEDDLRKGPIAVASNGIAVFNPINATGVVSYDIGELDEYGGHSGRGDDYHYHIAPLHLESTSGTYPIAYGMDGFAVYGSKEPDGATMEGLDEYHGHIYNDEYHYHGTDSYPFLIAKIRGKVTLSGTSPETQIEPQPTPSPVRGDPRPTSDYRPGDPDFEITDFQERTEGVGYILTYVYKGESGTVEYYWDENDFFTYIFTDPDGSVETQTFQR